MNQQEFFERILLTLRDLRMPHMLTGCVGAMIYGEPRLTNDIDVVVQLPIMTAKRLLDAFASDEYYCPPFEVVQDEILRGGQFNIIHIASGPKVDLPKM